MHKTKLFPTRGPSSHKIIQLSEYLMRSSSRPIEALDAADLLVAVFANFPHPEFKAYDTTDIITALFHSSRKQPYKRLFGSCIFDVDGLDPECKELSMALDTLQHSSLLGRMNPYLTNYTVAPEIKTYYQRKVANKVNATLIKSLADEVYACIKGVSPSCANA